MKSRLFLSAWLLCAAVFPSSLAASMQTGIPEGAIGQQPVPPAVGTSSKATSPLDKPSALTVGQELELRRDLEALRDAKAQADLDIEAMKMRLRAKEGEIDNLVQQFAGTVAQPLVGDQRARWETLEQLAVKALGGDYSKGDRVKRDDKGGWAKPTELLKAPEKKD